MTPPLCLWCEERPVRRTWGANRFNCHRQIPGTKSAWRNFCSRQCSGQHAGMGTDPTLRAKHTARLNAYNRERSKQRVITAIRSVMGEGYRDGDPVALWQLIRIARVSYDQGMLNSWRRYQRERVA